MCGRYTLRASSRDVAEAFDAKPAPGLFDRPRYNIAPTQPVPAVRADRDRGGQRQIVMLRWGLIPRWADDPAIGNRMINARAETAATKPAYRAAMRYHRCLLPADGFYEWKKLPDGKKQPQFIEVGDGELFALAGLWEHWQDADGNELETCTILTTEPNELVKPMHNRMPVILPPECYDAWLDPEQHDPKRAAALLEPFPADRMRAHTVSRHVNSPRNDDPRCVEPVEAGG